MKEKNLYSIIALKKIKKYTVILRIRVFSYSHKCTGNLHVSQNF